MSSPVLWGPNNLSINLQNGEILGNGTLISQNGQTNYIAGGNFANGTVNGFTLGTIGTLTNGLPTGTPTFGSGAAGTLSISAVSSAQSLSGFALSLVSSAATTAGNMVSSPVITIATEDQAKVLTFKGYYSVPTNGFAAGQLGGTSSNGLAYAIYDVTNSVWLSSAGNFNFVQGTGVGYCTGTCQTGASTSQIRVVLYYPNASTSATTINFTDLSLGPQTSPVAPAMSDSIAFTPTGSWTTNTTYTGLYSRRGEKALITWGISLAGAPTAATLTLNLPSTLVIDTTKLTNTGGSYHIDGNGLGLNGGFGRQLIPLYNSTTSIQIDYLQSVANASVTPVTATAPVTWANTDKIEITIEVPIVGWSSNSAASSDTDTRVTDMSATFVSGSTTAGNPIIFATVNKDSNGAYNNATGRYTIPVSGDYFVSGAAQGTVTQQFSVRVNASSIGGAGQITGSTVGFYGRLVPNLKAGDIVDIISSNTDTFIAGATFTLFRLSGPAVITATESVNARYYSSSSSITGSDTTTTFATKDFDSHNAYASGTYTIPVSGKYQINGSIAINGSFTLNQGVNFSIYKNGVVVSSTTNQVGGSVSAAQAAIVDLISCAAGDLITLRTSCNATTPTVQASNVKNYFSIFRAGN